jgi:hypothetical protein
LVAALASADTLEWDQKFGQVLHILLENIRNGDMTGGHGTAPSPLLRSGAPAGAPEPPTLRESLARNVRYVALKGLRYLVKRRPSAFADYLDVTVSRVLDCAAECHECYEVFQLAERALENLAACVEADRCYQVIP